MRKATVSSATCFRRIGIYAGAAKYWGDRGVDQRIDWEQ